MNFRCFRDISSQISDKPSETDSRSMKIRVNVVYAHFSLFQNSPPFFKSWLRAWEHTLLNTSEYAVAKFLDNMIKPYLPQTRKLKSTDHFIEELEEFNPNSQNTIMVSFDVVSLFTNVHLVKTIEIFINRLYDEL